MPKIFTILAQKKRDFLKQIILKLINLRMHPGTIFMMYLREFLQKPGTDDLVLIYFACHGANDPYRPHISYILPYDTNP